MLFYIVLTPISTTSGLGSTDNTRKYQQIDVYTYQCGVCSYACNMLLSFTKEGYILCEDAS